jgi:hypothetical protein
MALIIIGFITTPTVLFLIIMALKEVDAFDKHQQQEIQKLVNIRWDIATRYRVFKRDFKC